MCITFEPASNLRRHEGRRSAAVAVAVEDDDDDDVDGAAAKLATAPLALLAPPLPAPLSTVRRAYKLSNESRALKSACVETGEAVSDLASSSWLALPAPLALPVELRLRLSRNRTGLSSTPGVVAGVSATDLLSAGMVVAIAKSVGLAANPADSTLGGFNSWSTGSVFSDISRSSTGFSRRETIV